jgi:AAA15 family ATPase/GTPase
MLIEFSVANFKSLRDQQWLSLLPTRRGGPFEALPVVAIYGSNAGGKSNTIDSIRYFKRIGNPSSSLDRLELHQPFLLDDTSRSQPTAYRIEAIIDGDRYEYGITTDKSIVRSEYLYAIPETTGRRRTLFERVDADITFGASVKNKTTLNLLYKELPLNAPTLTLASSFRAEELQPFRRWLFDGLIWMPPGQPRAEESLTGAVERYPVLADLVRAADFGVSEIRLEEEAGPNPGIIDDMMSELAEREETAEIIPDLEEAERAWRAVENLKRRINMLLRPKFELKFYHNGYRRPFTIEQESRGTLIFLRYMARILDILDRGATLVIDEFDTSLHSRLIPRIIELFQDPATNPKNAQLIFSTHDPSLLSTSFGERILSRDEVWFVEKTPEGASELFPLSTFKENARIEHNWERAYMGGSYGAVPDIYPGSLVQVLKSAERNPDIGQGRPQP